VRSTLVDSGALIALFDPSAEEHQHYRAELRQAGNLLTTWPCVTEALHILPRLALKLALLQWIGGAGIVVHPFDAEAIPSMIDWIERYSERREMDFADASLVWLAQETGCRRIMTTDVRDFTRYRLAGGKRFDIL
jgi:uncharacterized protein